MQCMVAAQHVRSLQDAEHPGRNQSRCCLTCCEAHTVQLEAFRLLAVAPLILTSLCRHEVVLLSREVVVTCIQPLWRSVGSVESEVHPATTSHHAPEPSSPAAIAVLGCNPWSLLRSGDQIKVGLYLSAMILHRVRMPCLVISGRRAAELVEQFLWLLHPHPLR